MNIANLYNKLKQILIDINIMLENKGFNKVNSLGELPSEIHRLGNIDMFPYFINGEITDISSDDLSGVTSIGKRAFFYFKNLKSINIPSSVTIIENQAFNSCTGLTSVIIPDSVTMIKDSAFMNCTSLQSINIPSSVTIIESNAFNTCVKLRHIYLYSATPPTLESKNGIPSATTTIHVPVGSGNAYKTATNWSRYADKIVEDINV